MELESNSDEVTAAIEAVPKSDLATRAAAARANANFSQDPGVAASKIRGVIKQNETEVIVIDDDSGDEDDGYDTDDTDADMPHMVKRDYDSSDDEDDDDEDDDIGTQKVEDEIEVEQVLPHHLRSVRKLGRGQRERKKRTHYVPGTSEFTNKNVTNVRDNVGHFQGVGVLNLSYRGQKYHLKQGVVSFNLDEKPGVDKFQGGRQYSQPAQYTDGVLHLNLEQDDQDFEPMDEADIDEHIVGMIMANQYTLKKGLELFGEKAEVAALKEVRQIHDMATYTPLDPKTLSREEKNKALNALFFLTEEKTETSRPERLQ